MEYNDDEYGRESSVEELAQSQESEQVASAASALPASSSSDASAKPSFRILSTPQLAQWVRVHNQMDVGCSGNTVWTVSSAKHGNGVRHLMRHHDLNNFWQSDGVLPHVIRIQLGQLTPVEAMAVYVNSAVDQSYSPRVIRVKAGTHSGDMTEVAKADIGAGQECGWVLITLREMAGDDGDDLEGGGANDGGGGVAAGVKVQHTQQEVRPRQRDGGAPAGGAASSYSPPIPYSEVAAVLGHGNHATPSSAGAQTSAAMPMNPHNTSNAADRWLWCTLIDICICENQFNGRDCHLRGIRLMGPRYEELERVSNADATDTVTCARPLRGGEPLEGTADELQLR
ncbi:anaphase promoting complex subunit 10-like protein [Leishmania donovani]|uniref:Anaphase_promoting_complex_-_subunit_10-like_protein n=3 Tax=Leishmania donovani species complex TaxID=38574 RepID=A0A6L0WHC6_LEIIN|nr:anaphase promoting complex, subunit 10-like protein [Leishmania infantum JPCM5]XP_003858101.1 anaphase promoting complex, subunit 10-like protein [Leishmania donovani]CAC9440992.1 anaphase_promoting_complex_-_subunit_10-like_protein [Leishmania infantum]AYU75817.1 anaphase promoting complex, subunit 10-like protein [Leishmania donovani]TPP51459.1 Anaphase-promoting complex, subunit 10 (APC10) family protein [Leishmania donovani]TPP52381.1 Anaphase-promoting complex, subunit 10 (APC10) famil|eukprot:XP_001462876.1 anaphase promoting complex, subunit 10-like protein [Leishmania infantum JPCM5]